MTSLIARCVKCNHPALNPNANIHENADGTIRAPGYCAAHTMWNRWNDIRPDDEYEWGCVTCGCDTATLWVQWTLGDYQHSTHLQTDISDLEAHADLWINFSDLCADAIDNAVRDMPSAFSIDDDITLDTHPNIYDTIWNDVRTEFYDHLSLQRVYCSSCETGISWDYA